MNLIPWMRRLVGVGRKVKASDLSPASTFKSKIGRPHGGLGLEAATVRWVGLLRDGWMEQDHSDVPAHVEHSIEWYGERDPLFTEVDLLLYDRKTGEVEYEATIYKIEKCSGDVWCMTGRRASRVANIYGGP